jgi:opacity protein-like surface antigen
MLMRPTLTLLASILFLSTLAAAQGPAGVGANTKSSPPSRPHSTFDADLSSWQISLGYQYVRVNLTGTPYDTHGINASVTRFFGRWVGIEGEIGTGFGNTGTTTTPAKLNVNSVFAGGGARLALRNRSRIQPWIHGVVGVDRFHFNQTAGMFGTNSSVAFEGGGGIDYMLTNHWAIRGQADVVETHLFSTYQRHFQAVGAIVLNF